MKNAPVKFIELGPGTKIHTSTGDTFECSVPFSVTSHNTDFGTIMPGSVLLFAAHAKDPSSLFLKYYNPTKVSVMAPHLEVLRLAEETAQEEGASIYRDTL